MLAFTPSQSLHFPFWAQSSKSLSSRLLLLRTISSCLHDRVSAGLIFGFAKRYVCVEQLSCQSSWQWQFCSRASTHPSTFSSEPLILRNRGQRDDGWWRPLTGKYSIEGVCCIGWQWAHSGWHNTVLRGSKAAVSESNPESSQCSPLQ